jgi:hypothetical protein
MHTEALHTLSLIKVCQAFNTGYPSYFSFHQGSAYNLIGKLNNLKFLDNLVCELRISNVFSDKKINKINKVFC